MTDLASRLLTGDTTLWADGSVAADRLGWLGLPETMRARVDDARRLATQVAAPRVVLMGMGGSSLGPLVLGAAAVSDRLVVLDTTDPRTIAETDLDDAFIIVSSKSGTTLEVGSLLAHAWARHPDPDRYAVITDAGTPLAELGRQRGVAGVFENPPDVGGRYSVLSLFGLVPAALVGYDLDRLLDEAAAVDVEEAVALGRAMGEAALEGRDKVTIRTSAGLASFGAWVEQLIAESTGKHGKGCIPIPTTDSEQGDDRFNVSVSIGDAHELGREFQRWEMATAIAGHVLGIDPFDEPNVAESKANTSKVLANLPLPEPDLADPAGVTEWLRATVGEGDYVSLQAYLPYAEADALTALRRRVRDDLGGAPVTAGFGPRFLHSTGQLHKGGPNRVVAVQIVPNHPTASVPIPGQDHDFATLIAAQAEGDFQSLRSHGRRVLRVGVDHLQEIG